MNEKLFIESLEELGISINKNQLQQLNKYYELLLDQNKVMNLTNITEKESVYLKHFYDSLTIFSVCNLNEYETLCDVGTGAGFPGLVLKIMFPHLNVVLIDSLGKRINFLNYVIEKLNLSNISAIHTRAEDYVKNNRDKFDIVTSRAVARLSILNELCLPLVKIGGYFISMKGNALDEISELSNNLKILNSEIDEIKEFNLVIEGSHRTLIKFKKKDKIGLKYPRHFKEIKRKPL